MSADFRFAPAAARATAASRWRPTRLAAIAAWALVVWTYASAPAAEPANPASPSNPEYSKAFATVTLGAFLALDTQSDTIHESWDALPGLGLDLAMPFYAGDVRFLAQYSPLEGKADSLPDYGSFITTLGWGLGANLPLRLEAGLGASFGNYLMVFADDDLAPGTKVESEFCAGADLRLDWRLRPRWRLGAEMSYLQVFTATPLRLWFFRAGVRYRFGTSQGWREFWQ